jgi:beta-mannosidase
MPTIVSLNGSRWKCAASAGPTPDVTEIDRLREVFPATVPGDVHLDVLAATKPGTDLFFGFNKKQGDWVEQLDWWYWTDFNFTLEPDQRVWLVLHGADYISWTFLNGSQLGQHEGMFSEQVYEITQYLRAENRLAIRFLAPARFPDHHITFYNKLLNRYEQLVGADVGCDPERRSTLKCQMSYGWDFAPGIRTLGLWDDVELWVTGAATILSAQVHTSLRNLETPRPAATLDIEFDVDGESTTPTEFTISLYEAYPEPKPDSPVVVKQLAVPSLVGRQKLSLSVALDDPKLWYPWDHGAQNLYELEIVAAQAGKRVDRHTQTFGLRALDLSGAAGQPFSHNGRLVINGQPIFLRGASWVPADAIPARVSEADYQTLLKLAKEAHLNCLRVWGGGLREKRAFYDLCDRLGILVWQEFPLACAFYTHYPVSEEYQALLKDESGAIVRTLRHHPAIFLWCGGNEFDAKANAQVVNTLRQVVAEEDGTRLFMEVSPSTGESHNWNVWHQFFPPEAYRDDPARLLSEFGLQACPAVESLTRFLPAEALWPPGPAWTYHKGQIEKLRHYAAPFRSADTLEDFVRASQESQAYGLKVAIEHVRRRKRDTAGFSIWQLNSPWPSIDWAVLDFYRAPKLAYAAIKAAANPTLICLEFPMKRYHPGDTFGASVWVINDTGTAFPDCDVEIRAGGALLYSSRVEVAPASAQKIGDFTVVLQAKSMQVECRLTRQGASVSENSYALTDFDGRWIPRTLMTKLQLRLRGVPG